MKSTTRKLDPAVQAFLDQAAAIMGDAPQEHEPVLARANMEAMSAATRMPRPPGVTVSDEVMQANGRKIKLRIYRPDGAALQPGLIYMHGGGWVVGSIDTHDGITAGLAKEARLTVVSVNYSLAPEHPYPAALEDVGAATLWVGEHAERLGIDPTRLVIGGDSAGGNLAAATCLRLRDEGAVMPFIYQLLIYPVVDTDMTRESYSINEDAPFLNKEEMRWFFGHYFSDPAHAKEPYASPLLAGSHAGLPPAFVLTAEFDPLLDEGAEYAVKLIRAGVNVEYRRCPDLMHGVLRVRAWSHSAEREFQATCLALRKATLQF